MNAAVQKTELLPIAQIVRDQSLNCRAAGVDETVAAEYAEALTNGAKLPPVVVYKEGTVYRLADGWHRVRAHELAGKTDIACDVRKGDQREARLFACGANAQHGQRRTNADKRRAVSMLLNDPALAVLSSREIAKHAAVDDKFVGMVRKALESTADGPQSAERKGADGKVRKIPKAKKKRKPLNVERAAKAARKDLDRIAKQWADEPIEPLIEAVKAWIAERTASASKVA